MPGNISREDATVRAVINLPQDRAVGGRRALPGSTDEGVCPYTSIAQPDRVGRLFLPRSRRALIGVVATVERRAIIVGLIFVCSVAALVGGLSRAAQTGLVRALVVHDLTAVLDRSQTRFHVVEF